MRHTSHKGAVSDDLEVWITSHARELRARPAIAQLAQPEKTAAVKLLIDDLGVVSRVWAEIAKAIGDADGPKRLQREAETLADKLRPLGRKPSAVSQQHLKRIVDAAGNDHSLENLRSVVDQERSAGRIPDEIAERVLESADQVEGLMRDAAVATERISFSGGACVFCAVMGLTVPGGAVLLGGVGLVGICLACGFLAP